jgi:hypothetical protein
LAPAGPEPTTERRPALFTYQLRLANGDPATPPQFVSSTPTWKAGDEIFLNPRRRLRVLRVEPAEPPVLVVEPVEPTDPPTTLLPA